MKTKHLIAIIGIMLLASSCICDKVVDSVCFNEAQRQIVSYQKNETYSFICEEIKKKEEVFTVIDRKTDWQGVGCYDAMCDNYYKFEREFIVLSGKSMYIGLYMFMNWSDYELMLKWDYSCTLHVLFRPAQAEKNKDFWILCDQNGDFIIDNTSTFLHKTMEIGNNVYYDVLEKRNGKDVLFYNKTYGVLKLVENGKDYLTINR